MTTPRWLTAEEQQLWRMILSSIRKLDRTLDETLLEGHQLTTSEYAVLVSLSEVDEKKMRLREICQELDWDRSRASHQITRMDKKGLVKKVKCEGDARGVWAEMTDEGERRLRDAVPAHVEVVRSLIFDPMKEGQMEVLRSYLDAALSSGSCKNLDNKRVEDC